MGPIAFALLLGQSPPVDLQSPVTFEHRAAPVGRVLAKLSETTKLKFEIVPAVAGDVVLVSVKDVPLNDLLQKIATVTTAEWKQDGEIYRLVPSAGLRNREANDELAAKVTALRAYLADQLKPKPKGAEGEEAEFYQMGPFGNPNEPLLRIVQGLDLRALASLRPNERVVFSTQPNRMQRPLPANATTLINKLVADHNSQIKTMGDKPDMDEIPAGIEIPQFVRDMMEQRMKPVGPVSKALLIASRVGFGGLGGTNLELRLYDQNGKVVYTQPGMLTPDGRMNRAIARITGKETAPTGPTTPIDFSPETKIFQDVMAKGMMPTGLTLKPEAKAILYRPDLHDPLSFVPTDSLLALAKKRGKPVVANLPDEMMSALDMRAGTRTVEAFEEELNAGDELRAIADPSFLIVKPAKPAEARAERLDRAALAALMQAVEKRGVPSLDDIAAYATRAPNPMDGGPGQVYVTMLAPGAFGQSLSGITNWDALHFYGLLTPEARRNLAGGGRIPFAMLTPGQSAVVQKMVFGVMANLQTENADGKTEGNSMMTMMMMFGMGIGGDYRTEPTEMMPNGVPGDGFVAANVVSDFFASPVGDGDEPSAGPLAVLGSDELAVFKMFREDKNFAQMSAFLPNFERVKVGERTVWNFAFYVAPRTAMRTALNDNRLPANAKTIAMSQLPPEFQKRIAAKLEEVKKSPLGALGGMIGVGQQAPPP